MIEQIILKVDEVRGINLIDIKLPKNDNNIDSVIQILENLKLKPVVEKPDTQLPEETVEESDTKDTSFEEEQEEKAIEDNFKDEVETLEEPEEVNKGGRPPIYDEKIVTRALELWYGGRISSRQISKKLKDEFDLEVHYNTILSWIKNKEKTESEDDEEVSDEEVTHDKIIETFNKFKDEDEYQDTIIQKVADELEIEFSDAHEVLDKEGLVDVEDEGAEELKEQEQSNTSKRAGKFTPEQKQQMVDKFVEIFEQHKKGKSEITEDLAKEFGCSSFTVGAVVKHAGKWPEKKKKEIESDNEEEICEKYKNFKLGTNLKALNRLSNTHISRWIDMLYNAVEYGSLTLLDVKELDKHFPKEIYKFIGSKMEEILKELGVKNVNVEYKRNKICFESGE